QPTIGLSSNIERAQSQRFKRSKLEASVRIFDIDLICSSKFSELSCLLRPRLINSCSFRVKKETNPNPAAKATKYHLILNRIKKYTPIAAIILNQAARVFDKRNATKKQTSTNRTIILINRL